MKRLRTTLAGLTSATLALAFRTAPAYAQPRPWSEGVCTYKRVATIQGLECLIGNVLIVFMAVLGLAIFVMFIIGSFRWMLSGGNTKGTETARNTMTSAVVGLVLALSAFIILNLIAEFTGVSEILNFSIPESR